MKKRFKKIYIEITNTCNLSCNFCPKTKRRPEFMSLELFDKITEEAKSLCEEISLHIMGEPLSHPQIKEIIRLSERKGVEINLTTNGTMIKEHMGTLLNKTIRRINFSIHGIKANYSEGEQEVHLKNIIEFTKLAQKKREDMIISYRLWNINDDSNKKIIKMIEEEFGATIKEETRKISTKVNKNLYIHYDESFKWPNPNDEIRSEKGYCHALSRYIGILSNGTVVPCCLDNNGNIPLGNVKEDSIEKILSGERAEGMRKGFEKRMLVEGLCRKCTYIKRFEKGRDRG